MRRLSTALARPYALVTVLAALIALTLLAAACGGKKSADDKLVLTPVSTEFVPVVISSDLAPGPNRFVLGLLDNENVQVLGADLHLRFFLLKGQDATLKFEADTEPIRITKSYTHTHNDGTIESHDAGETGVYVATVDFDAPGQWGVEVSGTLNGEALQPVRPVFEVRETSLTPAIGAPAPRSIQTIVSDVSDVREIDTSATPIAEMHNMTIADAVTSGKPTVIVFATPAFCVSQICGPTKQIVDDLYAAYKGQANFIHVEPYNIEQARSGQGLNPLPFITDEWGLESEPWVFIVDGDGLIAGKYEGVVSYEELQAALESLL